MIKQNLVTQAQKVKQQDEKHIHLMNRFALAARESNVTAEDIIAKVHKRMHVVVQEAKKK